jgi:hypothetical protein
LSGRSRTGILVAMSLPELDLPLPQWDDPSGLVLLGAALGLALCLVWLLLRRRAIHPAVRGLLGPLASGPVPVAFCLRGMFVPGNELFCRAPADPRQPTEGVTVHKFKVGEVYSTSDVLALGELQQLLMGNNRRLSLTVVSGEPSRQAWSQDTIAIGPHYKSMQILDACEPRLVAVRQPAAFRSLISPELFEAREGLDFGLIYKGRHPATHRSCWVVMGLGDIGTAAAARFLHAHARTLGSLTGAGSFAAVIAVDTAKGWEGSVLRSLLPRPSWWRRLLFRRAWQRLTTAPWARPT